MLSRYDLYGIMLVRWSFGFYFLQIHVQKVLKLIKLVLYMKEHTIVCHIFPLIIVCQFVLCSLTVEIVQAYLKFI